MKENNTLLLFNIFRFILFIEIIIFFNFFCYIMEQKDIYKEKTDSVEKISNGNKINTKWINFSNNQILGDEKTGSLFDPFCLIDSQNQSLNSIYFDEQKAKDKYKLYVSKRNEGSIILYTSADGINYNKEYTTILKSEDTSKYIYNRATVIKHNGKYYMYYTKQWDNKYSQIYYGVSDNGYNFIFFDKPILKATESYEGYSVMNPNVIYDKKNKEFRMYYVSGEIIEPDYICLATSKDGIIWKKHSEPIMSKNPNHNSVDFYKVGATDIHYVNGKYYMFYIGYTDLYTARILLVTSEDGIKFDRDNYQIIVQPNFAGFDKHATYKPSAVYDEKNDRWLLYYNGRTDINEYIGLYIKNGSNLIN